MEYVQMTLNDWLDMKQKLKLELQGVKQSFVRIGYVLRKIDDQKLYEQDGYKSIAEFAKAEYGLEASTVSRFMSINKEYSIDGYSEHLREEYLEMGRSQLEEMLKLPDKDREMIRPETPRADIRELKHFNKTEPAAGVADDIRQLIIKFYEEHPDALNGCFTEETIERKTETVNQRGTETFRKGMYFMIMYEDNIKIKKFGADPTTLSWTEFFDITKEIFEEAADGPNTWKNYFGGEEVAERNADSGTDTKGGCGTNQEKIEGTDSGRREKPKNEVRRIAETNSENDTNAETAVQERINKSEEPKETMATNETEPEKEEIAPAQKVAPTIVHTGADEVLKEEKEEQIPGQMVVEDYPELLPENFINQPEEVEGPYMTRKQYMDTLTEYGAADYMAKTMRENAGPDNILFLKAWGEWFGQKVDEKGRVYE